MTETNEQTAVVRLPLWKNALDLLVQQGLSYGQTIPATWFEEQLRCKRDDMRFGLSVSEIRRELEKLGFYLSGRGQKGSQFVILAPEANSDKMQSYSRVASDALSRGVILGTNTRLDLLSDQDRRKHEGILQRMATKAVLIRRAESVRKIVNKHEPKLLKAE